MQSGESQTLQSAPDSPDQRRQSSGFRSLRPRRRTRSRPDALRRRWCIPSAILRSPGETLNGISILDEFPDSLGVVLWRALDDLTLWASAPPRSRAKLLGLCSAHRLALLAPGAHSELRHSLELLTAILADPGEADAEMLGRACLGIARWARQRSAPRTALAFAQVGSLAAPMYPAPSLETAACALALREMERAETWLRRTIAVARRAAGWAEYANAYAMLGNLQRENGNTERAEDSYTLALRTAHRNGIALARRDAALGLLQIAAERARSATDPESRERLFKEADEFARTVLNAQRVEQPGSVPVLLTLARYWITRGRAQRACRPLARLRNVEEVRPEDALVAESMSAIAYTAAAAPGAASIADGRAWLMLTDPSISEGSAFLAAMDLAHAAAARMDGAALDRAGQAALRFAPVDQYQSTVTGLKSLRESVTWAGRKRGS